MASFTLNGIFRLEIYLKDRDEDDDGGPGDEEVPAGQHPGTKLEPTNQVAAQQHPYIEPTNHVAAQQHPYIAQTNQVAAQQHPYIEPTNQVAAH